jgi:hypothetical protein
MSPRQEILDHEAAIALAQQNGALDAVATARARAAAEDSVAATRLARERKLHEDEARRALEQRTATETAGAEALKELVRTERQAADAAAMRAEAEKKAMEAAKARLEAETELARAKNDAREALRAEAEAKARRIEADERAAALAAARADREARAAETERLMLEGEQHVLAALKERHFQEGRARLMAEATLELRAATDKVREQSREVRFSTPETEVKPLDKILGRFNRKGDEGRSSPRGPDPSR